MLPITIKTYSLPEGVNARNWPGLIKIRPDLVLFAAVWAQESYESLWKLNPFNLISLLLGKKARRKMEVMGHEIEVQVATQFYDIHEDEYRTQEAQVMARHYPEFHPLSVGAVKSLMLEQSDKAKRWVDKHRGRIEDMR